MPGSGEALVKVTYAGVCGSDVHIFNGTNPIAVTPVVQGHEFTGEIEATGPDCDGDLSQGDRVIVYPLVSCGKCGACAAGKPHVCKSLVVIGVNRDGGFAQYVIVPYDNLLPVSEEMPDHIAVLSEPFSIGYHALHRGMLQRGEAVLIIGAGPIGLYTGITARALGAGRVVLSEPSEARRAKCDELGFSSFDPASQDWEELVIRENGGCGFDLAVETSGVAGGLAGAQNATAETGRIVLLGFPVDEVLPYNVTRAIVKELTLIGSRVCPKDEFFETLLLLRSLFVNGKTDFDAIIGDTRPLSEVSSAIADTALGRNSGKILIKPN